MPDLATLQQWLAEAYAAKHALMVGKNVVTLNHTIGGSNSVTFSSVKPEELNAYIVQLEGMIDAAKGSRRRRAFYIH